MYVYMYISKTESILNLSTFGEILENRTTYGQKMMILALKHRPQASLPLKKSGVRRKIHSMT